jgi:sugar-specific transcriptional regulator TrmB
MDTELLQTLKFAGLNEKESKIYLAVFQLGKATVYQIAKISELKRPIIYVIAEEMIEKGYLTRLPEKKTATYQAIDPQIISRKMHDNAKMFFEMLPFFKTLANKSDERPKLSYYESKEGITNIYEKLNNYDEQFYISSYSRLEKHFPGIIKKWAKSYKRNRRKINGKHLIPDNFKELEFAKDFLDIGQEVKTLPKLEDVKMDFAICDDLLVISSLGEKPFAVAIESKDISESLKAVFNIAWQKSKEIS